MGRGPYCLFRTVGCRRCQVFALLRRLAAEETEEASAPFSIGFGWAGVDEFADGRPVAAGRGERQGERVEFLERVDPGAVGDHAGAGGAELALDLVNQVAG
jgi:hypothetical protein